MTQQEFEQLKELIQSIPEKKKKHDWIQTISIILAIAISLIALFRDVIGPYRAIWATIRADQKNIERIDDNQRKLIQYIRSYHPETKRENGGFLDNPWPTRTANISFYEWTPWILVSAMVKYNENENRKHQNNSYYRTYDCYDSISFFGP